MSDTEKDTKQQILDLLDQNVNDYHELPHYGLIPDWYKRYWESHMLLREYFNEDDAK